MTSDEFKQRLLKLQEDIMRALAFYSVWNKLRLHDPNEVPWSLEDQNRILGRWNGFFMPVSIALQEMAMLAFAKVFDTDNRTSSLYVLLEDAARNPGLIPHAESNFIQAAKERLGLAAETLETIRRLRNQKIAHTDANAPALPPLMNKSVESLAEEVKWIFNKLSSAHDRNVFSWEYALKSSDEQTTEILRLLLTALERRQAEFDQRMVEIGIGHIRSVETTLGRSLAKDEFDDAIRTLGLTDSQVERVRAEVWLVS